MTPEHLPITQYDSQLTEKHQRLSQLLSSYPHPEIEVFRSPVSHYRMRAEFRLWHEDDDLYHIMFDQATKSRIPVTQFPAASQLINQLMPIMIDALKQEQVLRHKIFQIDYLTTLSGEALVTLLYHRPLNDEWIAAAKVLRDRLRQMGFTIDIIGRATKTKIVLDKDYIEEALNVNGETLVYRQVENSFTQPNAAINISMLEWAQSITQNATGDLLELYCGNGNFSIALAKNFNQVLATEIAKPSVESAQYNISANNIDNLQIIRMSAEEFTQAMQGVREFNRLKGIDLQAYNCETIFVDPPRSGLDEQTLKMVQQYPRILYISCNPETLRENLSVLSDTHAISRVALFDQFPYTHHMESGVLLTLR